MDNCRDGKPGIARIAGPPRKELIGIAYDLCPLPVHKWVSKTFPVAGLGRKIDLLEPDVRSLPKSAAHYCNFQDSLNRPAYAVSGSSESCWTLKIAKSP